MEATERIYNGIKFKKKGSSLLMKIIALLLSPFTTDFLYNYWTTIGSTIYVPDKTILDDTFYEKHENIIIHEFQHIKDHKKYHILYNITYLLPPVLNYMRFVWERRAYKVGLDFELKTASDPIHHTINQIEFISNALSGPGYLWCWPKKCVKTWFYKQYKI